MTYDLGQTQTIGGYRVAVISESVVIQNISQQAALYRCIKRPICVLVRHNDAKFAVDMTGAKIPITRAEELCADAVGWS